MRKNNQIKISEKVAALIVKYCCRQCIVCAVHILLPTYTQMLRSQLEATQLQKTDLEKQISTYHSEVQSTVKEYQKRLAEAGAALSQCQQQLALER